jgi:hypothetical protein
MEEIFLHFFKARIVDFSINPVNTIFWFLVSFNLVLLDSNCFTGINAAVFMIQALLNVFRI